MKNNTNAGSNVNKVVVNAKAVYKSFLLLDIVNNQYYSTVSKNKDSFKLDDKVISFKDFIANLELAKKDDQAFEHKCKIGTTDITLRFKKKEDGWITKLIAPKIKNTDYTPKDIGSTTGEALLSLLSRSDLYITFDQIKNNAIAISTHINGDNSLCIGGVGKIELYHFCEYRTKQRRSLSF